MRPRNTRMYPADSKYTKDHEWVKLSGGDARVGHHGLRAEAAWRRGVSRVAGGGPQAQQGRVFGTIESVKAVSELYAPVTGEVMEVNRSLAEKPEAVNSDPHESWMIVLKVDRRRRGPARRHAVHGTLTAR